MNPFGEHPTVEIAETNATDSTVTLPRPGDAEGKQDDQKYV